MILLSKQKILKNLKRDDLYDLDELKIIKTTASTNEDAKDFLKNKNKKKGVFLAEQQTLGKGRNNRKWVSPFGKNIYLSLAWKTNFNLSQIDGLSLATAVVIADNLQSIVNQKIEIKWPNDLIINNKKFGGILIETSQDKEKLSEIVIGIGININMTKKEGSSIDQNWVSLSDFSEAILDRNVIASKLIKSIIKLSIKFPKLGFDFYRKSFENLNILNNKQCVIVLPDEEEISGKVIGINKKGEILIENKNNLQSFRYGEISIRENKDDLKQRRITKK